MNVRRTLKFEERLEELAQETMGYRPGPGIRQLLEAFYFFGAADGLTELREKEALIRSQIRDQGFQ